MYFARGRDENRYARRADCSRSFSKIVATIPPHPMPLWEATILQYTSGIFPFLLDSGMVL